MGSQAVKGQTLESCDTESPVVAGRVPSVMRVGGGSWEWARKALQIQDLKGTGRGGCRRWGAHPSPGLAFEIAGTVERGGGGVESELKFWRERLTRSGNSTRPRTAAG